MRETIVVANAKARGGRRRLEWLEQACFEAGVELLKTSNPGETRSAAGEAARNGCRLVIAAGGDGTVHHVLNSLAGTETALGILPLGTANDLARSLNLPLKPEDAFRRALTGTVRRVDLGRVRAEGANELFAGVASFGLAAAANRLANELSFPGGIKYTYALLRTLLSYEPATFEIESDKDEFEENLLLGLVGNAPSYGGGMKVTPRAVIDDGLLDACLVGPMPRLKLMAFFPQVFFGSHLNHAEVSYFQTRRLRIECLNTLDVFADGELVAQTPVEFDVLPASLKISV